MNNYRNLEGLLEERKNYILKIKKNKKVYKLCFVNKLNIRNEFYLNLIHYLSI